VLQKLRFANEQNNALVAVMPALQLGSTASLMIFIQNTILDGGTRVKSSES